MSADSCDCGSDDLFIPLLLAWSILSVFGLIIFDKYILEALTVSFIYLIAWVSIYFYTRK